MAAEDIKIGRKVVIKKGDMFDVDVARIVVGSHKNDKVKVQDRPESLVIGFVLLLQKIFAYFDADVDKSLCDC